MSVSSRQLRVRLAADDYDSARTMAAIFAEAFHPAPIAVAMFEHGSPRHVIDAYFDLEFGECALREALSEVLPDAMPEFEVVPDENWVAISQAALSPVEAGRFTAHGSHDRERVGRRLNGLLIDAGEAFGTAHHATTLGCLLAIDRLCRSHRFRRILDMGTGSGVLAIAAAQVWPVARVTATDNDPVAIMVAQANGRRNREGRRVSWLVAQGFDHPALRQAQTFDLVIANILAAPLISLAPFMRRGVRLGGQVVLSGILSMQAAEVRAAYHAHGFALRSQRDFAGWTILQLVRR